MNKATQTLLDALADEAAHPQDDLEVGNWHQRELAKVLKVRARNQITMVQTEGYLLQIMHATVSSVFTWQ